MKVFNARTQKIEEPVWTKDTNGELVATFEDDTFVKFPANIDREELELLLIAHQEANEGQEVITEGMVEAEARAQAEDESFLNGLNTGNTMPESDKTDASTEPDKPTE